jgi:Protein of unknown function VcgC/VcgE (DUF2780)
MEKDMKQTKLIIALGVVLQLAACASAPTETAQPAASTLGSVSQVQQAAAAVQAYQSNGLVGLLTQRLGVTPVQAQGGAGALFQMAKGQMQPGAFAQLSKAVPGMGGLLQAAPAMQPSSGLGGIGNMVGLASAFQQSGMSPGMIQRFVPVILEYVKGTGGGGLAGSLGSAFLGL